MSIKGTGYSTAAFRPRSAGYRYSSSPRHFQEAPQNDNKYPPESKAYTMRSFKKWYNDTKQKQFNIINHKITHDVSRVRKLVDMHSHAFDFTYDYPYKPNTIKVIVQPSATEKKKNMKSSDHLKHRKGSNNKQEGYYEPISKIKLTSEIGVQVKLQNNQGYNINHQQYCCLN